MHDHWMHVEPINRIAWPNYRHDAAAYGDACRLSIYAAVHCTSGEFIPLLAIVVTLARHAGRAGNITLFSEA